MYCIFLRIFSVKIWFKNIGSSMLISVFLSTFYFQEKKCAYYDLLLCLAKAWNFVRLKFNLP